MKEGSFRLCFKTRGNLSYLCKMQSEMVPKWQKIIQKIQSDFNKTPDVNAILFLIGMRELGLPRKFTKEEKVELMHIAVCRLLSTSGYYELEGVDSEGWPHWKSTKKLPFIDVFQQENFLRQHIIEYFESEGLLDE